MATDNNFNENYDGLNEKLTEISEIKTAIESMRSALTDNDSQAVKEKLDELSAKVEGCTNIISKDVYENLEEIKKVIESNSEGINKKIETLGSAASEFYGGNDDIVSELKRQTESVHNTLKEYIGNVITKISENPTLNDIGSIVSDINEIQQKNIKQINTTLNDFKKDFDKLGEEFKKSEFASRITQISEIYENLNIINAWIEKVGYINQSIENVYARLGENIDFDDVAEKIDIVYENLSALNSWTVKVDHIDDTVVSVKEKLGSIDDCIEEAKNIRNIVNTVRDRMDSVFGAEEDFKTLAEKTEKIYETLSSVNEWSEKTESLVKQVENIDSSFDDEMIFSKIDLIYENMGLLNEWVNKIDLIFTKNVESEEATAEIKNKLEEAGKLLENVPSMKTDLSKISEQLNTITNKTKNDEDSYIYTLLDIESDFLKMHKMMDESTKATAKDISDLKESFTNVTDDISSISIRTNKLILSADDANDEFKELLKTLKSSIANLDNQTSKINPEPQFDFVNQKMAEIAEIIQRESESTRNLNTAIGFLAEWADASGIILNSLQSESDLLKSGVDSISDDIKGIGSDLRTGLKDIRDMSEAIVDFESGITHLVENSAKNIKMVSDSADDINEVLSLVKNTDKNLKLSMKQIKDSADEITELKYTVKTLSNGLNTSSEEANELKSEISEVKSDTILIDKAVNQFMQDLKTEMISLNEKMAEISETGKRRMAELENFVVDKISEQERVVTLLEEKMDRVSIKLDKIGESVSRNAGNAEIKEMLGYITSQINSANDAIYSSYGNTVRSISDKLSSFDESISKVVSYIEE